LIKNKQNQKIPPDLGGIFFTEGGGYCIHDHLSSAGNSEW
jgi:hypothetical protein